MATYFIKKTNNGEYKEIEKTFVLDTSKFRSKSDTLCFNVEGEENPTVFDLDVFELLAWILLIPHTCILPHSLDAFEMLPPSSLPMHRPSTGLDAFDLRSLIYFFSYWRKNIQALCGLDAFQFLCHIRSRGVFVPYSSFWFCASNSFRCTIPSFVTKYACSGLLGLSTYRNLTYPLSIAGFR